MKTDNYCNTFREAGVRLTTIRLQAMDWLLEAAVSNTWARAAGNERFVRITYFWIVECDTSHTSHKY